jgi:hypothetical protein
MSRATLASFGGRPVNVAHPQAGQVGPAGPLFAVSGGDFGRSKWQLSRDLKYMAQTLLKLSFWSSSPTCPATQSGLYQPTCDDRDGPRSFCPLRAARACARDLGKKRQLRSRYRALYRASEPLADRLLSRSLLRSRQTVVAAEEWAEGAAHYRFAVAAQVLFVHCRSVRLSTFRFYRDLRPQ